MNINELKNESVGALKIKLLSLYKERMKLRFERVSGTEFIKTHLIKFNRRNIARVLTLISEKGKDNV